MRSFLILALVALALAHHDHGEKGTLSSKTDVQTGTPVVVNTESGVVKGTNDESRGKRMYYKFLGIPYAKAEKFQPPVKVAPWTDVKDATEFGSFCPQYSLYEKKIVGDDDCLNLNVYTPKLPTGTHKVLLPVIVYIDGGGFKYANGNKYNPKYFMDNDVVFVTFNYRVGPYGFLNTGDKYAQGNQGMKDQVEVLKWVQQNVENFGGDKDRVTIMGNSAGATSVTYHLLSPMSKGLFRSAVAMSGTAANPASFTRHPIASAKKLGTYLDCPIDTSENLVNCLAKFTPQEMFDKIKPKIPKNVFELPGSNNCQMTPSIENILEGQTENDVFLTQDPYTLMKEGKVVNKVPIIMGINENEGNFYPYKKIVTTEEDVAMFNKDWETYAPRAFGYDRAETKDIAGLTKKLRDYYFNGGEINRENLTKIYEDRFIFVPVRFSAFKLAKVSPVFVYCLGHPPKVSFLDVYGKIVDKDFSMYSANKTSHSDQLQYLFEFKKYFPEITTDSEDFGFSNNLVNLLTSFAENGKPTKIWEDAKEWPQLIADDVDKKPKFFKIGTKTSILDEPDVLTEKYKFYKELYVTHLGDEIIPPPKEDF